MPPSDRVIMACQFQMMAIDGCLRPWLEYTFTDRVILPANIITAAFTWSNTPQNPPYWARRAADCSRLREKIIRAV